MFREQVGTVSTWFDRWSPCEQTVAMVALLRRLQPTQARFLTSVLQRQLLDSPELRRAEIFANDPNSISSLGNFDSREAVIRDLLAYLPLLNPKNSEVKALYLALIPKVLKYTLDHCAHMEEARQLLSYSLIHPAFTVEDRGLFATWLHQFEEKLANGPMNGDGFGGSCSGSPPMNDFPPWQQPNISPSSNNASSLSNSPASQSGLCIGNFGGGNNFHRIRRSNSLTPPVLHSDAWNSQEELYSSMKPRSLSLSSEVSPQSSLASSGSGSESHLDDPRPSYNSPGMKDVPAWLKSLRLHKYSFLFAHITFEEMLELNESRLEAQGVTKGARHKIVLSIGKLKERSGQLKQIYEDLSGNKDSVRNALSEVKWMLTTPIKPTTEPEEEPLAPIGSNRFPEDKDKGWPNQDLNKDDLTSWIVRVIGKACEMNPDLECEGLLVSVLDKCLSHDAFSCKHKRLLSLWRQQQSPQARRNSSGHHHFQQHRNNGGNGGIKPHGNRHFTPRVLNLGPQMGQGNNSQSPWTTGNSIQALFMAKRPSLQDSILESARSHLSVQRTKSAPLPNFFTSLSTSPPGLEGNLMGQLDFSTPLNADSGGDGGSAMDITSRLESLCLSMTEAALGPAFSNY